MKYFFVLCLANAVNNVYALLPKKMPNGEPRRFMPNMNEPRKDLQVISAGTASLISRNWMQNILLEVMSRRRARNLTNDDEFIYDDLHIMSAIQELQKDIEYSQKTLSKSWTDVVNIRDTNVLYFAWKPRSCYGINEVLFIVVGCVKKECEKEECYYLDIQSVIQSPFWDEQQIPSIYLKEALIDQTEYTNQTKIRFNSLYDRSLRYKLAWDTWFYESEDIDVVKN